MKITMPEPMIELPDDSVEIPAEDKTLDTKNENLEEEIGNLPSEDDLEEDPLEEEGSVDPSVIAQKVHWRRKAERLEKELEIARNQPGQTPPAAPADEKQAAAEKFLADFFERKLQEREIAKVREEQKTLAEFELSVTKTLEQNPAISENEILDAIEEYNVEPEVAAKILQKQKDAGVAKPRLPSPKRGSPRAPKKPVDDTGKSYWQIAQEVISDFRSKTK